MTNLLVKHVWGESLFEDAFNAEAGYTAEIDAFGNLVITRHRDSSLAAAYAPGEWQQFSFEDSEDDA
jgi:hypothetical protein